MRDPISSFFKARPYLIPDLPFGSLQIIVGLFELAHVFVQLVPDAARLAQVVLQHGDLLVALSVLLLQFVLGTTAVDRME